MTARKKKDHYETLGISRDATTEQITAAYRKLVFQWHPDKYSGDEKKQAEAKVREINEAYTVLNNKDSRQQYDNPFNNEEWTSNSNRYSENFGFGGDEDGLFKEIWEGFFNQNRQNQPRGVQGESVKISLTISFKELMLGTKKKVELNLKRACTSCRQSGAFSSTDIALCPNCRGTGSVGVHKQIAGWGVFTQRTTCTICQGYGKIIKKKCSTCSGTRFVDYRETILISIRPGINLTEPIRIVERGNDGLLGGTKGDIYIKINVPDDHYFKREGSNVYVNLPISFLDAIFGNEVLVITLEGVEKINIPSGARTDMYLRLPKRGGYTDASRTGRGDFYVCLKIVVPKKEELTKDVERLLNLMKNEFKWNPNHDFIEKNKHLV